MKFGVSQLVYYVCVQIFCQFQTLLRQCWLWNIITGLSQHLWTSLLNISVLIIKSHILALIISQQRQKKNRLEMNPVLKGYTLSAHSRMSDYTGSELCLRKQADFLTRTSIYVALFLCTTLTAVLTPQWKHKQIVTWHCQIAKCVIINSNNLKRGTGFFFSFFFLRICSYYQILQDTTKEEAN